MNSGDCFDLRVLKLIDLLLGLIGESTEAGQQDVSWLQKNDIFGAEIPTVFGVDG